MVALPEDVKEVNDFAESDTVDQVAEGSGKNQRQGKKGQLLVFSESLDIPEDPSMAMIDTVMKKGMRIALSERMPKAAPLLRT